MEFFADIPDAFTADERAQFFALVERGDEVDLVAVAQNIENARTLVFCRNAGELLGVAALKRPIDGYRKGVGAKAEFHLTRKKSPLELGYVYVVPEARGRGYSHRLVAEALSGAGGDGVYATVRADNAPMLATLIKTGFEMAGQPYPGRKNQLIKLLVRPPALDFV